MNRPGLRRKNRAWYFDTGGKPRKWIPLGSDEAAALIAYERLAARPASGTVAAMLQAYMVHLEAGGEGTKGEPVAPATLAQYRAWHTHLHRVFGHLAPEAVTQGDVLLYLVRCPRTSSRGEISFLSGAYRLAMLDERITFNPCIGAKLGKPRAHRDKNLTHAEYDALYAVSGPLLRLFLDLAYMLALRVSDVCSLRWDQFDDGSAVHTKKTGARQRFTLTEDLRAVLEEARAMQGNVISMYVIPGSRGRPIDRHKVGDLFRAACKAAGVADAQPRDIRAKAGTERDAEGGDAQRLLGHEDARTTKVYLRGKRVRVVEPMKRRGTGTI
jgi:integrase